MSDSKTPISAGGVTPAHGGTPGPAEAEEETVTPTATTRYAAGILGLACGVAGIVLIASLFAGSSGVASPATSTLGDFELKGRIYWQFPVVSVMVFALLLAPFFGLLGETLSKESPGLSRSATILSTVGALVVALAYFLSYYVLSDYASSSAPTAPTSSFDAAIWVQVLYALELFGVTVLGGGLLIFATMVWTSSLLPHWFSIVGFVGGVSGLLAFVPSYGGDFALVTPFALVIWCLLVGGTLSRPGRASQLGPRASD